MLSRVFLPAKSWRTVRRPSGGLCVACKGVATIVFGIFHFSALVTAILALRQIEEKGTTKFLEYDRRGIYYPCQFLNHALNSFLGEVN